MNMMRCMCTIFAISLLAYAEGGMSFTTIGGAHYEDARLREVQGDLVVLWHSGGISKIPISQIPDDTRSSLGLMTSSQVERLMKEQQRRDAEATKKGLVRYGNEYVTPEEKTELMLSDKASSLITEKSERNVAYRIFQVLDSMILCARAEVDVSGSVDYLGEPFALIGFELRTVAEGERYQHDIYWCGTYSYINRLREERTVPLYTTDYSDAFQRVRSDLINDVTETQRVASIGDAQIPSSSKVSGGTGFAISNDGDILTNYHVVEGAKTVMVKFGANLIPAAIVASDKRLDLAIIKVSKGTKSISFSGRRAEKLGMDCFVVGFPNIDYQGITPKVTKGIISGLKGFQDDENMYQIDAAVQPGNSGGPVVDDNGNAVGVVVALLSHLKILIETGVVPQNVNYCIKGEAVKEFLSKHSGIHYTIDNDDEHNTSAEDALESVVNSTYLIICES